MNTIVTDPATLQRLLFGCLKFDNEVQYKQRKSILLADALSHVCFQKSLHSVKSLERHDDLTPGYNIHFVTDVSSPVDILSNISYSTRLYHELSKEVIYKG